MNYFLTINPTPNGMPRTANPNLEMVELNVPEKREPQISESLRYLCYELEEFTEFHFY